MTTRRIKDALLASFLLVASVGPATVFAKVAQTLDQVKLLGGAGVVLEAPFNDPYRPTTNSAIPTAVSWPAGLVACRQTSAAGLTCLTRDEWVVNWPDVTNPTSTPKLFSCNDISGLLEVKGDTCTGLTADEYGAIWLAGKNKAKSHSLVKVTPGACSGPPSSTKQTVTGPYATYCAETWDTGRPLLLDVNRVDGEVASRFTLGETILGLEQRLNAVIFSASAQNSWVEIPGGKNGWALGTREQLQSITLLQQEVVTGATTTYKNYVLVTTSLGRVLAKDTDDLAAPAVPVILPAGYLDASRCTGTAAPEYAIRTSPKGGIVYLSYRNCFATVALQLDTTSSSLKFVPATEKYFVLDTSGEPTGSELTRNVPVIYSGSTAPDGLAVAPGEDFSLGDCGIGETCSPVKGATLSNIVFAGNPAVTLYKIVDLPDCRWIRQEQLASVPPECNRPGVIVDPNSVQQAAAQYLNVQPLLPQSVIDSLVAKGITLPGELLIAPQYRAQSQNTYRFQAFFVAVDPGVKFTGTFDGLFDTKLLAGVELGCKGPTPGTYTRGLDWDIVTKVSERHVTTPAYAVVPKEPLIDSRYVDLLINTACGSSATKSMGFSLFAYNLEVTADTYLPGRKVGTVPDEIVEGNDAVFARLLEKLFYDLDYVAKNFACADSKDEPGSRPISAGKCTTLLDALANTGDKLGKCIEATYQPKQSASNQNCTAFLQQFDSLKTVLHSPDTGAGSDPANRVGELDVRTQVLEHVYHTRFWPSVPAGGFTCETYNTNCGTL